MTAPGLVSPVPAGVRPVLVLDAAGTSVRGPRTDNQDAGYAGPGLLVVADGVGGKVGGAVASSLVVDEMAGRAGEMTVDGLRAAVAAANERLRAVIERSPQLAGMATTLTAVVPTPDGGLAVAHIGDSRAYLLRDGVLRRLTADQTLVQGLVDAGQISEEEARAHPLRSIVLAALRGGDDDLDHAVVTAQPAAPGNRVLVCSDGLTGVVESDTIRRVLLEERRPADAVTRLLAAATASGTQDNATAVVADLTVPGRAPVEPAAIIGSRAGLGTPPCDD